MQRTYGFDVRSTVTLPHFSVTETISLPRSAAVPETTAHPEQQTGRCVLESAPEREIAPRRDAGRTACADAHERHRRTRPRRSQLHPVRVLASVGGRSSGRWKLPSCRSRLNLPPVWWIECPSCIRRHATAQPLAPLVVEALLSTR